MHPLCFVMNIFNTNQHILLCFLFVHIRVGYLKLSRELIGEAMDSATDSAIFVGLLAFLGVVFAPIITSYTNDQRERRRERHNYILSIVTALIDLRKGLQYLQLDEWELINGEVSFEEIRDTDRYRDLQTNYGMAYAIMISVDIKEIRDKAPIVMGRVEPSKKLDAIDFALKRLGEEYGFFKENLM